MNFNSLLRITIVSCSGLAAFCISHHESYDHTFYVSHYIKNETSDSVEVKFESNNNMYILPPLGILSQIYSYFEPTISPTAAFVIADSLEDMVHVSSRLQQKSISIKFAFDTISYPDNLSIRVDGEETFLYSDTFVVNESNFIDGHTWTVMNKTIF